MALFRRRDLGGTDADPAFGFLSAADASEVRSLVRQALAERGLEVTVFADHVVDASGSQFGLWNVMAACHNSQAGRAAWPGIVREHIRKVLHSSATDPFASLTAEDAAQRTYIRLYETAGVPELTAGCYRDFAPGLVELLALDSPETVAMYPPQAVERLGGWAALREHGLANLASERDDQRGLKQVGGPQGVHFNVLLGPSVYTASQALRMPGPAAELASEAPGEYGWLLSVPNRSQLAWHMINDISVVPSINAMAAFSLAGYNDGVGPLSPHVYWWDGTSYQQLTEVCAQGDIRVVVRPDFRAVLERLAERAS